MSLVEYVCVFLKAGRALFVYVFKRKFPDGEHYSIALTQVPRGFFTMTGWAV